MDGVGIGTSPTMSSIALALFIDFLLSTTEVIDKDLVTLCL